MKEKYYSIFGVMAIIAIILISGCKIQDVPNDNIQKQEDKPAIGTMLPYIEFEASVVSLSLDKSVDYSEGEEINNVPVDSAVVRIDKIIGTGGSNSDWSSMGIEEGKEVSLEFKYTARPAKIITVVGETRQSGDVISRTIVPTKVTFENNYFVFRENGNEETEIILPGLKEGSKFKTRFWDTPEGKIGMYELIP